MYSVPLMSHLRVIFEACGAQSIIFLFSMVSSAVIWPMLGLYRDHVISLLMSLGAACLAGDAIFHLIPHALEAESHQSHESTTTGSHLVLWRSLLIICGIYLFYLLHLFFHSFEGGHSHSPTAISPSESFEDFQLLHRGDSSILEKPECRNKRALLWMMMFSEALHTTSDGLATGAAFSSSVADGLSTSLAVLFHEIPHAVGAFAIFVSCGVLVKNALCLLSLCYIISYVGVVVGAVLGASLNLSGWIFAVIAGMFLFLALAEMIPEMSASLLLKSEDRRCFVLLQNVGLVLGFSIMMALAAFEDKIRGVLQ